VDPKSGDIDHDNYDDNHNHNHHVSVRHHDHSCRINKRFYRVGADHFDDFCDLFVCLTVGDHHSQHLDYLTSWSSNTSNCQQFLFVDVEWHHIALNDDIDKQTE
jgi:hypothetical protein